MSEFSRMIETPARRRPRQLFDYVRVRVSRKRWALYRVRLRNGVSRVLASLLLAIGLPALAAPVGGRVVGGEAQISYGQTTTVRQTTARTAINWQQFGIAPNEAVRFIQPSSSSVALNRVLGGDPSQILGTLSANGQVFILNSQGVYFGRGAHVDTGGLVVSTLALSDSDFNAGLYRFSGTSTASVKNDGVITAAPGGYVVLAGAHVANNGTIVADDGSVALAGGSRVSLDLQGDRLVNYSVDASALRATVENAGLIQANGGSVSMLANVAGGALATAVNQSGVIRANSVSERDGIVSLRAIGGDTVVTGSIDVSGRGTGQTGGRVEVLGDRVGLFQDASIDASGYAGGGTVLVGGDLHGEGGVPTSDRTVVDPGARIAADAIVRGDGGKVVVWSDGNTSFNGQIEARGGAAGGNGGYVETSGKQILSVLAGGVDASAPHGRSGTWLLDPNNLTIRNNDGHNVNMDGWATTDDNAILDARLLGNALTNGTSVEVLTASNGHNTQDGDINIFDITSANLTSGQRATLTLDAQGDIIFHAGARIQGGAGALNLNLNAGTQDDGNNPGTNVSRIIMDPKSSINTGGGDLSARARGQITLGPLNTGNGTLTIDSNGGDVGQVGAWAVGGDTTISLGAANQDIVLGEDNQFHDFIVTKAAEGATLGTLALRNVLSSASFPTLPSLPLGHLDLQFPAGSIDLPANLHVTGELDLSAGDSITQAGAVSVDGTSNLSAPTITLTSAENRFAGQMNLRGGTIEVADGAAMTVNLEDAGVVTLSAVGNIAALGHAARLTIDSGAVVRSNTRVDDILKIDAGGAVNLENHVGALDVTAGGAVSQDAGSTLIVDTTTSIDAPGQAITLANASNNFVGAVSIVNGSGISLADVNDLDVKQLGYAPNSAVSLVAAGALTLDSSLESIDTGTANLTLSSGSAMAYDIALAGNDVSLRGGQGVTLMADVTARHNLAITTTNSDITGNVAVSAKGTTTLTAGAGKIELANTGNDFGGAVTVQGHDVTLYDKDTLTVGGAANTLTATATLGDLVSHVNTVGDTTLTALGGLASNAGHVSGSLGASGTAASNSGAVNGNATLTASSGAATNSGGVGGTLSMSGATASNSGDVGLDATLKASGNATNSGDVGGMLAMNGASASNSGNVLHDATLTAEGGDTVNSGDVGGTLSMTGASASNSGNVALDATLRASGNVINSGDVGGMLAMSGASASNSGNVLRDATLTAEGGGATNSGDVGGTLSMTGTSASNSGNVALDATLKASGNVINSGDVGGMLAMSGASASNSGDVGLDAMLEGTGDVTNSGNVGGTLTTSGARTVISGRLGGLVVDASGQVLQQANSSLVVLGDTTITSEGQSVILANAGNDFVGQVLLHTTADDAAGAVLRLHDINDLNVGTIALGKNESLDLSAASALNLAAQNLDAGTGSISLTSGKAFTTPGELSGANIRLDHAGGLTIAHDITAHGTLDLAATGADILQTAGAIQVDGATSVQAGAGRITLADEGNDFGAAVTLAGGSATLVDVDDLTLAARVTGALVVRAGATSISGDVGSLALTAAGDVRQPGSLVVREGTRIDARGHDVALGNSGNDFQGAVVVNADDLTLADRNALNLGATNLAGALKATTGGAVTQSGALVVGGASTFDAGASAVSLTNDGNELTGAVSSLGSGAVDLHNDRATVLGAMGSDGAQAAGLEVHSNGDVRQTGAAHVSGNVTIYATDGHGRLYAIDMSNADNQLATSEGVHGADPAGDDPAVATFIGSGLNYYDNAGRGNVSRVDVDGIAGDASVTTSGSKIGLFGTSFNGRTLGLYTASTGGEFLERGTSGQYELGERVVSVTTSPKTADLRKFLHANSADTKLNDVQVTALEQMGGIALGGTVSTVIDEERRARERAAGYGRVRQGMRLNSISFDEMIAPLQYKQLEVSHAPCAREQSEGLDDLSCLPQVQPQE